MKLFKQNDSFFTFFSGKNKIMPFITGKTELTHDGFAYYIDHPQLLKVPWFKHRNSYFHCEYNRLNTSKPYNKNTLNRTYNVLYI